MEVKHRHDEKKGSFYVELDSNKEAEMTYKYTGPKEITIDHTEVSDKLKGEGVGHKLINAAVDYMRKNNLKAIPECPFVQSVFNKKGDELADVRA